VNLIRYPQDQKNDVDVDLIVVVVKNLQGSTSHKNIIKMYSSGMTKQPIVHGNIESFVRDFCLKI